MISKASYSVYLIHAAVFVIMDFFVTEYNVLFMIAFIIMTVVFSGISYYYFEGKLITKLSIKW